MGDTFLTNKDWAQALEAFKNGINKTPNDVSVLKNLANISYKLGKLDECVKYANLILNQDVKNGKAIFWKGSAMLDLMLYDEAADFLKDHVLVPSSPESKVEYYSDDIWSKNKKLLEEARGLQRQRDFGEGYDMAKLVSKRLVRGRRVSEFTKRVKVESIPGKNRGLVATEDILAGQIVLVAKPLAITHESSIAVRKSHLRKELYNELVLLLKSNPEMKDRIYHFWAGKDLKFIEKDAQKPKRLDEQRLRNIILLNSLSMPLSVHRRFNEDGSEDEDVPEAVRANWSFAMALYELPSYVNHSCFDGNVLCQFYGEYCFLRALKLIKKGDEILMTYVSPSTPWETFEDGLPIPWLQRNYTLMRAEVDCTCRLCVRDQSESDTIHNLRELFLLGHYHRTFIVDEEKIRIMLDELEEYRADCPELNTCLMAYGMLESLAYAYIRAGQLGQAKILFERAYVLTHGTQIGQYAPELSLGGLFLATLMQRDDEKKKWTNRVKESVNLIYGNLDVAQYLFQQTWIRTQGIWRMHMCREYLFPPQFSVHKYFEIYTD